MATITLYISLAMHLVAAGFAISLVRKTKFNVSWILISSALILMLVSQVVALMPEFVEGHGPDFKIVERWLNFGAALMFLLGIFFVRKIIKHFMRVSEFRQKMENRILTSVIKAEERERQNFAKELHDGLGPLLSVVKMLLSGFTENTTREEGIKLSRSIQQAVDEALVTVREISANISPHILKTFGLYAAVEAFVKRLGGKINVDFKANFKDRRFPPAVEFVMYRVVGELITNTIRHAEAENIGIRLEYEDQKLTLFYEDDGIGFSEDKDAKGMGLENMRYRLRSGNGDLSIQSAPGKGMKAKAFIHCNLF